MFNTKSVVVEILPGEVDGNTAREVYRNLQAPYGTMAGEQALGRKFGIDGNVIDYPQENAQILLVAEYIRETEWYEPRAKAARMEWTGGKTQDGTTTPKVVIEIV